MIAPHPCPECDELAQELAEFSGGTVPDEVFAKHVWDLPLLSDDAKHYYLPAWLRRARPKDTWGSCDALVYALEANHRWLPQPPYTEAQWLAVDAVLESCAQSDDPAMNENVARERKCIPR